MERAENKEGGPKRRSAQIGRGLEEKESAPEERTSEERCYNQSSTLTLFCGS
jgi:hypothetical protein